MARALEIGTAEGLEAVSLRRLAHELGVTPMALYRYVRDKQDLINAMTEVVLEGIDATAGFRPGMTWTERFRLAIENYKKQLDARPLALPLSIAYTGEGPPSFWKVLEQLLAILLDAGFARREAIVLIRMISNLLAGYMLLLQQGAPSDAMPLDAGQIDLMRRRFALSPAEPASRRVPEPRPKRGGHGRGLADGPERVVGEHGRSDHVRLGANARAQARRSRAPTLGRRAFAASRSADCVCRFVRAAPRYSKPRHEGPKSQCDLRD